VARLFDAGTEKVYVSGQSLNLVGNDGTIMAWCRLSSPTNGRRLLANEDGTTGYSFRLTATGTINVLFSLDNGFATANGTTALSDGDWHLVCGMLESTVPKRTVHVFVDDMDTAEDTTEGPANDNYTSSVADFTIGNKPTDYAVFDGDVGEVAVWTNTFLSAGQRKNAKNLGFLRSGAPQPDLYIPLWGASSPEPDFSGNGYAGTVSGATQSDHPPVPPPFGITTYSIVAAAAEPPTTKNYYGGGMANARRLTRGFGWTG
jgi:hypothetical protein